MWPARNSACRRFHRHVAGGGYALRPRRRPRPSTTTTTTTTRCFLSEQASLEMVESSSCSSFQSLVPKIGGHGTVVRKDLNRTHTQALKSLVSSLLSTPSLSRRRSSPWMDANIASRYPPLSHAPSYPVSRVERRRDPMAVIEPEMSDAFLPLSPISGFDNTAVRHLQPEEDQHILATIESLAVVDEMAHSDYGNERIEIKSQDTADASNALLTVESTSTTNSTTVSDLEAHQPVDAIDAIAADAAPPLPPPQHKHPIVSRMVKCLNDQDRSLAMETFCELVAMNKHIAAANGAADSGAGTAPMEEIVHLPPGVAKGLFRLMAQARRPFDLYQVLLYYMSLQDTPEYMDSSNHTADTTANNNNVVQSGNINAYARMYNRLCDALRHIDPHRHAADDCQRLVGAVWRHLQQLNRANQQLCYPTFVSAMVAQKYYNLGVNFGRPAYEALVALDLPVPDGFWVHLLSFSRYNRQTDLPFADVLTRMVDAGRCPRPVIVLNVLDNLFPFTDTSVVSTALKAILRLQQGVVASARDGQRQGKHGVLDSAILKRDQFYVDIQTLEMIGAAAASQGHSDVNLLIWDMLDVLGYAPTEAIYENTVTAFAMNSFTYREAFTVLAEMESRGFTPSRALIRSFSIHVRDSIKNLDFAYEQLRQLRFEGKPTTTASLNVLMSGAAECGDIHRVLSLLQEFDRHEVPVNADTFSFCFESLGKNLIRRKRNPGTSEHTNACLIAAESFLTLMESKNIEPDHHIIRNYVELLCEVGQFETASAIVLEAAEASLASNNSSPTNLVCSKTIYRVAMANAKLRQFDVARQVAACLTGGEPIPFILAGIEREEQQVITSIEQKRLDERDQLRAEIHASAPNNRMTTYTTAEASVSKDSFWSTRANQRTFDLVAKGGLPFDNSIDDDDCATNEERYERRRDENEG